MEKTTKDGLQKYNKESWYCPECGRVWYEEDLDCLAQGDISDLGDCCGEAIVNTKDPDFLPIPDWNIIIARNFTEISE